MLLAGDTGGTKTNLALFKDEESVKFLKDEVVKQKLANAKKLSTVNAKDYDAIFYVGGHGPVIDLASDPVNAKLVSDVSLAMFLSVKNWTY